MPKDKGIPLSEKHGVNPSMSVCFWCGEVKGLVILGKLPEDAEAPREAIYDLEPCDACKQKMAEGITLFSVDDVTRKPTGDWCVIKEGAVHLLTEDEDQIAKILKDRRVSLESGFYKMLTSGEETDA